eukprot:g9110.t1
MSRPPTMSMLLKRAGLAKRPRLDRATPSSKQRQLKRKRSTGAAQADGSREDSGSEGEAAGVRGMESGGRSGGEAVDDQIAALERELQANSEDSSSSSSDDERPEEANGGAATTTTGSRERRRQLKLLSPLEAEKIEPLPGHLLPRPGCGMPKANKSKKNKKPKGGGPNDGGDAAGGKAPAAPSQGLDSAVKELLANYEARSAERVPFYCRVCQFQGKSLEDLERHKEEPLHVVATKKERKVTFCNLCKKQFTSPPQLKEHLAGKAHFERLQAVMARQGKRVPGGREGRGRQEGSGGGDYSRGLRQGFGRSPEKSSSQQCRKRKAPRQGGGLVVVNQRNLNRATAAGPPPTSTKGKAKGKKKKKKKKKGGGLSLGELMASGDDSEDFDAPFPAPPSPGGVAKYVFSSAHHTPEQRLYYLLATRPCSPGLSAGVHQQQSGGGGNIDAAGGGGGVAAVAVEGGCHVVIFVETTAVAQELVGVLKALGLVAFALHDRTPKLQAQERVKRFLAAPSADRSSVLILTNAALARSPPSVGPVKRALGAFLRVVHFDAPEGEKNAAARGRVAGSFSRGRGAETVEEVHLGGGGGGETAGLAPFSFDSAAMGGIRSRLAVAKKLSKAVALSAGEGGERGMQRAAAAAGLEWDEGGGQSDTGAAAAKREKKRAHAQKAAALRQKISVLLCQPLLPPPSATSATDTSASPKSVQQSAKELRKKMVVLGMIHGGQALGAVRPQPPLESGAAGAVGRTKGGAGARAGVGAGAAAGGAPEERAAAQTRWLDGSAGESFGGAWAGSVRRGASCDRTSLEVRAKVEAAKQASSGGDGNGNGRTGLNDATAAALAKWNPNPDTPDPERWGGRWGKPCGHNEVVLQHLRPFAPMEVVNTRVCSRASPAPGNAGFDGCLELLSLVCRAHGRALTVWDDASFVHVDGTGAFSSLPKRSMLHLSLPALRFLVRNMRGFTVCGGGQEPPREVARAVILSAGWGAKQSKFGPLSAELSRRVLCFVLSGDVTTWRSISAELGVRGARPGGSASGKASPGVSFAGKKKRKNFNL